jgi:ABC-type enterochelin transport system ATPase subunit
LLSNKILGLKNGNKVFFGSSENLMKKNILNKIFDYDFFITKHPKLKKEVVLTRL